MTEKIIKILKRFFTGNGIVILILLGLISLRVYDPWPVQVLRLKSWDFLQTTLPKVHSNDVVIVEIDEKSVPKYGQWPWDRKDIADIIDKLRASGAGIIVIPAVFSEPDRAKGDDVLAKKIKENGVVIAQTVTTQTKKPDAQRRGVAKVGEDPAPFLYSWPGALKPINILANNADGVGVIASAPEPDGVVRRMPMLVRIQDNIYPSLTMEALRVSTGDPSYQVKASEAGIEAVRVPQYGAVTTDPTGSVWMNWNYEFDRISVADDFKKRVKDKVVILGVSLEGVGGVIATPTGSAWSHDMQAAMIQTIVDKNNIQRYAWSTFIELLCIVAIGIAIIYFVPRASVLLTVPIIVVFIGLYSYSSYYLFTELHQLWDYSWPVVTGFIVWSYIVFNKFAKENALKKQIAKQFGTYLSPALVAKLQKNPELLQLGGDERELSIMFTDVRGFTTISEHYGKDVQGLTKIMNRYMTAMTKKIIDNNGTLDKYIGDAQMAFWNAPVDEPRHAHMAAKTALEMMGSLDEFNKQVVAEGVPAFGMGLGINSAAVVVGNMGSDQRFDYTCLGDGVNLASRLEGQSKPYGVKIVLGQRTAELIKDEYYCLELDCIAVKGKKEGVYVYTLLGNTNELNIPDEDTTKHNAMLELYRKQKFDAAIRSTKELMGKFNGQMDHYYELWIDRCKEMKQSTLPADWDGVYRATSK
mgnify:CR=1 FL=1|jgi:adenylate cyclase